ncbi:MAG: mandelate racemase/muconate lactonizing enzyme family protein [Actinomycetota bacterium]|nr:mandelate racemase/muconate lactonizing enzyme family protein [Actinomycetota bacterium]
MKIASVRVIPLGHMKDEPAIPRSFALVRIESDEGIVGWGEASSAYGHSYPLVVKEVVEGVLARALVGKEVFAIEHRLFDMRRYATQFLGSSGVVSQAIGGVEIALWDILGKACGLPLFQLLGGRRSEVRLYGTGTTYFEMEPTWHAEYFAKCLAHGFRGVKVRVGKAPDWDLSLVSTVRDFIGDDVALYVDAFMSYSPESALEMARRFSDYGVGFFEEPVRQEVLGNLTRLVERSPIPIAVGERLYSVREFEAVVRARAADVLQPDATIVGGLREALRVCDLGALGGYRVIPHIGGLSAVGIAANLHVACASDAVSELEYDIGPYQPLRDEILMEPVFSLESIDGGVLRPPESGGLGIEIDELRLEAFAYERGDVYPDIYPHYGAGDL